MQKQILGARIVAQQEKSVLAPRVSHSDQAAMLLIQLLVNPPVTAKKDGPWTLALNTQVKDLKKAPVACIRITSVLFVTAICRGKTEMKQLPHYFIPISPTPLLFRYSN